METEAADRKYGGLRYRGRRLPVILGLRSRRRIPAFRFCLASRKTIQGRFAEVTRNATTGILRCAQDDK
jgi:hypothetical protein